MRGHVSAYKRNVDGEWRAVRNKWKCTIELGYVDGKREREFYYVDGCGKREAEADLAAHIAKMQQTAVSIAPVRGTVGMWLDEWLRVYVEPRVRDGELAASTAGSYAGIVKRYLKPALGDLELKKLKPEHVTALYMMMGTPKAEGGNGVSPRTRELTHVVLRSALAKAVELGRLRVNVLERGRGVDRPKARRREVTALEELDALALMGKLAAAEGPDARLYLPALLALATGMRRGELLALRWDEVTLPAEGEPDALGMITVSRAWDAASIEDAGHAPLERYRVKEWPKSGKTRYIDIPPEIVAVLREARAEQDQRRKDAGDLWFTKAKLSNGTTLEWGDLVVTDEHGFPFWPDSFSGAWRKWRDANGLTCRFHDLRATSGSLSLAAGTDPEVVRRRLGHHSAAFFLERYAKAMHEARERDAGIMGALVSRVPTRSMGTNDGHQSARGTQSGTKDGHQLTAKKPGGGAKRQVKP